MDNTPDFDNMTPEEIMRWMETLAARQGATEGLTTSADMDIAEIDPNSVVIDEPGYVPYGQEGKQQPEKAAQPKAAPPVVEKKATTPEPPKPALEPVKPITPPPAPPSREVTRPAAQIVAKPAAPPPPPKAEPVRADESGLAWLESLAGGDEDNSLFNLDLSALPTEEASPMPASMPEASAGSLSWLEDLAREQDDPLAGITPPRQTDPFGGSDTVEWLESLARRQGADTEELITPAQLQIPLPDDREIEAPGYVAFSFDSPPVTNRAPAPAPLNDPTDFLSSLADDAPPAQQDEDMSMDAIQRAIAAGTVTREQMQMFLEVQTDSIINEPEAAFPEMDEDADLAPADLPPWLLEQIGAPPAAPAPTKPTASLDSLFPPPAADTSSDDMPSWLIESVDEPEAAMDFGTLFEDSADSQTPVPAAELDPNDTWAEAFDLEHESGEIDVSSVPDWYERNVNDPARIAAVEQRERRPDDDLIDEMLPGDDLPVGEAQSLPLWVDSEPAPEADAAPEPAYAEWLAALDNPQGVEVPDWLMNEPTAETFEPEPEPEPEPVAQIAPPPPPAPQPVVPRPTRPALSLEALERARDREQNGDLEGSLSDYEGLIRANIELDTVVADLTQLVKSYRTVPAVYRVLGDGLMRQGKLQQALNTYREALNQL